jgi:hypothetical protein
MATAARLNQRRISERSNSLEFGDKHVADDDWAGTDERWISERGSLRESRDLTTTSDVCRASCGASSRS